MAPNSAIFLLGETREHPLHVGGVQLFQPPPGANAMDMRAMFDAALADGDVASLFQKRAYRSVATLGQWAWETDKQFDIEHHVRRSALPQPGTIRELLTLCSRLHSSLLDRHRPLWEMHMIEGLADGRIGMYFKAHHALLDGVAALRLLRKTLSADPDERGMPPQWAPQPKPRLSTASHSLNDVGASALHSVGEIASVAPSMLKLLARGLSGHGLPVPAPKSVFNVPITGARRFAAQSWPIARIKAVGRASGTTVNDVVLAMCAGALRAYLQLVDELLEEPLVAMVPVSLRSTEAQTGFGSTQPDGGGNAVGMVLCNLGTTFADPAQRLVTVHASMQEGKAGLAGLTQLQSLAMSAVAMSPLALEHLTHAYGRFRPAFNVLISNVPGPEAPLYWNGARLDGMYPLGLPMDGQALNITCTSYVDEISFGIVGCRRTVPHLQRLLRFLDDELTALEAAVA